MFEQEVSRRTQRPVTVLAVLFGLLVGLSGAGAVGSDAGRPRVGNGGFRTASSFVLSGRPGDQRHDEDTALPPAPPQIVTTSVSLRPAATALVPADAEPRLERRIPYRSRAPPAA